MQIQSTIESISTRRDRTLKIVLGTQELSEEQNAELFKLANKIGWFVFKESEITEKDLDLPNIEFSDKTPSKRMRNVIYRLWEKETESGQVKVEFEEFYNKKMEQLITFIKAKLD